MTGDARITGVVLAAGAGRRMGGPKAELRIDGRRMVDTAVSVLARAGCADVVAVVRAGTPVEGARVVVNPDPERGMRSSLALGVDAAAGADAVAVVLVDTPGLTAAGCAEVLAAWRPGRITVARYRDGRGHPTVMAPSLWLRALALAGADEGARALLRDEPGLLDEVGVSGSAVDLDTADDLRGWAAGPGRAQS